MNLLTKTNLAVIAIFALAVAGFLQWYRISSICESAYSFCSDFLFYTKNISAILFWLLLPALLTTPLASGVFESWKRFAIWAAPLVLALSALLLFAGESGPYGFSLGITPLILLVLYGLYFLVSLVIIGVAAVKTRKQ